MSEQLEWSEKARAKLEEIKKNSPSLVEHYAYRYLHFEDRIDQMGGWANFKHYIVKAKDRGAMQALQKENELLKECVDFYAEGEIGNDLEIRPEKKELWSIPEKWSQRSMSDHYAGKRARECKATIDRLLGGEK